MGVKRGFVTMRRDCVSCEPEHVMTRKVLAFSHVGIVYVQQCCGDVPKHNKEKSARTYYVSDSGQTRQNTRWQFIASRSGGPVIRQIRAETRRHSRSLHPTSITRPRAG
ncbi:unnamed protein product, partial [Ectocarpus sp. 4 AP-2014]